MCGYIMVLDHHSYPSAYLCIFIMKIAAYAFELEFLLSFNRYNYVQT